MTAKVNPHHLKNKNQLETGMV